MYSGKVLITFKILTIFVSAAASLVAARICGPGNYARVIIAVSLFSLVLDLIDFGGASWAARELAAGRIESKFFKGIWISRVIFLSSIPVIIFISKIFVSIPNYILVLSFYPMLWVTTNYFQHYCFITKEYFLLSASSFLERGSWFLTYVFYRVHWNVTLSFACAIVVGLSVHAVLATRYMSRVGRRKVVSCLEIVNLYKLHYNFGIMGFVSDLGSTDTFLIRVISTAHNAGIYSIPLKLQNPFTFGFSLFTSKNRPVFATCDRENILRAVRTEWILPAMNSLGLVIVASFFSKLFAEVVGTGFQGIIPVFTVVCISYIFQGFFEILITIISNLKKERLAAQISTLTTILNLIFIAVGVKIDGSLGAAFGYSIGRLTALVISGIFLNLAWRSLGNGTP